MANNKKRIGILTFHRSINYGAFMQSYALSSFLSKELDVEVEIIDFEYLKKNIWQKLIVLKRSRVVHLYKYLKQYITFRKSLSFLKLSPKMFICSNHTQVVKYINSRYDIVIVGSDGVWAYNSFKLGVNNVYFLPDVNIKKMSYAATSFGLDYDNIPDNQIDTIKTALNTYKYIGVRDLGTKKFISKILNTTNISLNCDPTFLLDLPISKSNNMVIKRHQLSLKKPIICLMIDSEIISRTIKERYGSTHTIVSLFNHNVYADYFLYDLNPIEWSQIFSIFSLVFTSYFHGSILSLMNNVPVIAFQGYPYNKKYISKIEQVFNDLELSEYCFITERLDDAEINKVITLADRTLSESESIKSKIKLNVVKESLKIKDFITSLKNELI